MDYSFWLAEGFIYKHHLTYSIAHTMVFVTPVVREIAQWVDHEGHVSRSRPRESTIDTLNNNNKSKSRYTQVDNIFIIVAFKLSPWFFFQS